MNEASLEAAANISGGDVMAAELDPLANAGHGLSRAGEPEVVQFDFVAALQRALKKSDVSLARAVAAGDEVDCWLGGRHTHLTEEGSTNSGVNWLRQPKMLLRVLLTASNFWRSRVFMV